MRRLMTTGMMLMLILSLAASAQISSNGPVVKDYGKQVSAENPAEAKIAKEVRHEILMLPWYSLFDDLEFTVQGRTVTLSGFVTSEHSVTKSDAANAVKHIEGVDNVINNIEILPPSPLDTRVREQVYEALSRTGGLSRYFWEAAPSVHIIVKNQRVTLAGFVNSEMDKNMATIAANGVSGVFQVTNNLRVVK
ncbi:MAG TPA: BON domain-containing protein [Terriglobales bacterium]